MFWYPGGLALGVSPRGSARGGQPEGVNPRGSTQEGKPRGISQGDQPGGNQPLGSAQSVRRRGRSALGQPRGLGLGVSPGVQPRELSWDCCFPIHAHGLKSLQSCLFCFEIELAPSIIFCDHLHQMNSTSLNISQPNMYSIEPSSSQKCV